LLPCCAHFQINDTNRTGLPKKHENIFQSLMNTVKRSRSDHPCRHMCLTVIMKHCLCLTTAAASGISLSNNLDLKKHSPILQKRSTIWGKNL